MQTALIITSIFVISGCSSVQNSSRMIEKNESTIVELTSFNLIAGTDEAKFIKTANQMQQFFLNGQEGFVKRTLVKGKNGWTDIVHWTSPQAMQKAMKKAESASEVAPFMQMIDFTSVKMNLSEIKMNVN